MAFVGPDAGGRTRPRRRSPRLASATSRGRRAVPAPEEPAVAGHRVFAVPFASIYPHYVAKAERKGQRREDVDLVVCWLTGYDAAGLERALTTEVDLETFFA